MITFTIFDKFLQICIIAAIAIAYCKYDHRRVNQIMIQQSISLLDYFMVNS